jgi:multicomponent Na+:H+ antiporter subunit A
VDNLAVLSLLAFAPIVVIGVLLVGFRWPAKHAMPIGFLVVVGIAFAVWGVDLLTVVASSLQGLVIAGQLLYIVFGAPDLAMTQFLVETLTVIIFVLVFYRRPRFARTIGRAGRVRDAIIALAAGAVITTLVLVATRVQVHEPISQEYALRSVPEAHGRNVVNVILTDFRALDTLGEAVVLAIAAMGVYTLLHLRPGARGKP